MLKLKWGEQYLPPCALMLGGFDGLHEGHKTLFVRAAETTLPVGLTSISGGKAGGDVFTPNERAAIFERAGFAFVTEMSFSEIKDVSAEAFLQTLFSAVHVKKVFCGEDFRFGRGALGTAELLKDRAPCPVEVLPIKTVNGVKVATSSVKRFLAQGDLPSANALLSGDYFIRGEVEHGRQVGRTYGFPTLNLSFPAEKFPLRAGVYGGVAHTGAGEYRAIINVGPRPTFGVRESKVEAHLLGFHGDLYGETVEIYPAFFIREIVRFGSAEKLREQLEKDILAVGELL